MGASSSAEHPRPARRIVVKQGMWAASVAARKVRVRAISACPGLRVPSNGSATGATVSSMLFPDVAEHVREAYRVEGRVDWSRPVGGGLCKHDREVPRGRSRTRSLRAGVSDVTTRGCSGCYRPSRRERVWQESRVRLGKLWLGQQHWRTRQRSRASREVGAIERADRSTGRCRAKCAPPFTKAEPEIRRGSRRLLLSIRRPGLRRRRRTSPGACARARWGLPRAPSSRDRRGAWS